MAATSSAAKYRRDKNANNEAQDFGGSAKRQAIQLGQEANVFSAVIYYDPISRQLDGAIHVPRGQSIPNVNQLLRKLSNGMQPRVPHRHDRATPSRRQRSTPVQNGISVETINKADRREKTPDATVFKAAVTLCHTQEKPYHVANSVTAGKKRPSTSHGGANCSVAEGQHSAQFTEVPQRMAVDGTESLLKARDQLPRPAQVRSRGLEMSSKDALKAAEIRRHRFFRLVAMQLRRSGKHAK